MRPLSRLLVACASVAAAFLQIVPAQGEPQGSPVKIVGSDPDRAAAADARAEGVRRSIDDLCRVLRQAAADNDLPEEFFTRLIWQESRFDPTAVSPAGAQGIAQFMPQTAASRGLVNAFEPYQALRAAASYLRDLRATFGGNLGLAAAAYNAGRGQVEAWLAGRSTLPGETVAYVRIVTGHAVEAWASQRARLLAPDPSGGMGCAEFAKLAIDASPRWLATGVPAWRPWVIDQVAVRPDGRVPAGKYIVFPGQSTAAAPLPARACAVSVRRPALGNQSDKRDQSGCDTAGPGRLIIVRGPGG
jgi:hypothetical protein